MLYTYLLENYKPGEPIFLSDIDLPVTDTNLRRMFKILCDTGKLRRFDKGIYYIPSASRLRGGTGIAASMVMQYQYIERRGRVDGYYSGFTFANQLGITGQVPYVVEIVTNNTSSKRREINMKGQRVILRRPRTTVNSQNCRVLQLLDLLKDIGLYADEKNRETVEKVSRYIQSVGFTQSDVDSCISLYPDRVYRNIYEMRLYNVFA